MTQSVIQGVPSQTIWQKQSIASQNLRNSIEPHQLETEHCDQVICILTFSVQAVHHSFL